MHAIIFHITYNLNTILVGKEKDPLNNSESYTLTNWVDIWQFTWLFNFFILNPEVIKMLTSKIISL